MKLIINSIKHGFILEAEIGPTTNVPRIGDTLAYRHLSIEHVVNKVIWYFEPTEVHIVTD